MSLQERLGSQDAVQLLTLASSLALATAAGEPSWGYNLPLMLFGIVSHELSSSHQPLRQFISLAIFSAIFDLFNLFSASFGFTWLFALVLLVLKAPIVATCIGVLKERGGEYAGVGGFGVPQFGNGQGIPDVPRRDEVDVSASRADQADWTMPSMPSMPGGFGGSQQQQPQQPSQAHQPSAPASFPASGGFRLGGDEDAQGAPPAAPQPGRNGYSSIA